ARLLCNGLPEFSERSQHGIAEQGAALYMVAKVEAVVQPVILYATGKTRFDDHRTAGHSKNSCDLLTFKSARYVGEAHSVQHVFRFHYRLSTAGSEQCD